jgi:DNA (cytosine-5)-methyltransferase 1
MRYASVCDGIGAAHVAWKPLGWQCSWTSEIEPFPAAVVEHHFGFANVGDMTKITEEMLHEHGPVDLLVGGTPCQSFSVAGLRGGLADPRGNLALRFVQLASVMQPKWIVWENVPGVLSSGKGRDFGTFLGALGELGYGFAYRVLDAQWFGVAQRRRRVFVVGYLGDWRRAAAVLFERESVFGNPPTRGKAWERASAATEGGTDGGLVWRGGDQANSEVCVGHAGTLNCDKGQQGGIIAEPFYIDRAAFNQGQNAQYEAQITQGGVAAAMVARGPAAVAFGAPMSEPQVDVELSQTLQRTNMQAVAFQSNLGSRGGDIYQDGSTNPLRTVAPPAVAFKPSHYTRGKDGAPAEVAAPLSADADKGDQDTVVAQGFTYSGYSNQPAWMTGDCTDCLPSSGHSDGSHQGVGVAIGFDGFQSCNPKATHQATHEGTGPLIRNRPHCVATAMAVRRLTPRECERLQGFPDDYTLVEYRKKLAADGPRYRALGNSMAVPVMRWIGERIKMVDAMT